MNKSNQTVEVLKRTRELVAQGWCQEAFAKTKHGQPCAWSEPEAGQFCISGAVRRAAYSQGRGNRYELWKRAGDAIRLIVPDFVSWNDEPGRTQQEVLDLLDRAIAGAGFWESLWRPTSETPPENLILDVKHVDPGP